MESMNTQSVPTSVHGFFDAVRECSLRLMCLEEMVACEAERVATVRKAGSWLGAYEGAALCVVTNMERRFERYLDEYRESAAMYEAAEKLVSRMPGELDRKVITARYLYAWEMDRILRELSISRGTVYNAERRAFKWLEQNGFTEVTERLRATRKAGKPCGSAL